MTTVDLDLARQLLDYDPETGVFTWLLKTHGRQPGRAAGTVLQDSGFVRLHLRGTYVYAHRLAFALTQGYWPQGVNHADGDPSNNRADNLREGSSQQRSWNMRKRKGDTSSRYKGVYWRTQRGRWCASIYVGGRRKHLGVFDNEDAAGAAYARAATQVAGEFARVN